MSSQLRLDNYAQAEELRRADEVVVSLTDRILGMRNKKISIEIADNRQWDICVRDCSDYWVHGYTSQREMLISLHHIVSVEGIGDAVKGYRSTIYSRHGYAGAIRALADKYGELTLYYHDKYVRGRVMRVGKDYIDLRASGKIRTYLIRHITCVEAVGVPQW